MTQRFFLRLLAITMFSVAFVQLIGCKKATEIITTTVCDVRGTYSGTNLASTGASSTLTYKLQDNNFAVGSVTPTGAAVTFGGYRNTCDSVILSVYYAGNSSYYLLQGKLLNNGATISGSFKNLTTPSDFGTFSISK
jgi:hypothetical protein